MIDATSKQGAQQACAPWSRPTVILATARTCKPGVPTTQSARRRTWCRGSTRSSTHAQLDLTPIAHMILLQSARTGGDLVSTRVVKQCSACRGPEHLVNPSGTLQTPTTSVSLSPLNPGETLH